MSGAYQGDNHYSNSANDYFQVRFNDTQIKLYAAVDPADGIAAISIDGGTETMVDFYAASRWDNVLVYTSPTLSSGQHTLKVRVTGTKHASSMDYYVTTDRVDIVTASVADTTYGFEDQPNGDGQALNGVHSGIDFGTGQWSTNTTNWNGFGSKFADLRLM